MENLKKAIDKTIEMTNLDREDISKEIFDLVAPMYEALVLISDPMGAYSKDPLTMANNVIENCKETAINGLAHFK